MLLSFLFLPEIVMMHHREENFSEEEQYLLMDRAYEDDKTRSLAIENEVIPVVPPKRNRKELWDYDKELYSKEMKWKGSFFV